MSLVENRAKTLALLAQFDDTQPAREKEFYLLLATLTAHTPAQLAAVHRGGLYDPPAMQQVTFHRLHQHYQETLRRRPREEYQALINAMTWIMEACPWVYIDKRGVMLKTDLEKETRPDA